MAISGNSTVSPDALTVNGPVKQDMGKSVDAVLQEIGQFGRFQVSRLMIFCLLVLAPTFHSLNMFFIGAEPPWQCVTNSTTCHFNGTFAVGDKNYDFRCKLNRSDWEYAQYDGPRTSVITQFDLVCDDEVYGWLAKSMVYIGMAIFTIPLGMLADRYGRLVPLFPSIIIICGVGFASAFATKYWQFLVSRFVIGSFVYGVFFPVFILSGEFVGPRHRPLSQTIMWFAFTFALLLVALVAYYVRDWRNLMIFCTAPWLITLVFWPFIPESIRWYTTHHKMEKAEACLRKIAKTNKKEYPNIQLQVPQDSYTSQGFLALFSTCWLAFCVFIQTFAWFVNGMVYYGASYGASDLGGSMYLNFVLTSLIEIPANTLVVDNCARFGRKKTVIVHMILGGAACFIVSLIPAGTTRTDYIVGRVIGGMLGKGFITVSFNSIYIWSGEIFPTVVRNSGMGLVGVLSRVGAVTSPFVVELKRIHPTLPFGVMGGLAIIAALFCLILPETKDRATAEVIEVHSHKNMDAMILQNDADYKQDEQKTSL